MVNLMKGALPCVMRSGSEFIILGYDNCHFRIASFLSNHVSILSFSLSAALDSLIQMKTSTMRTWAIAWTIQIVQRIMSNRGKLILRSWRMHIWIRKKSVRGSCCVGLGLRITWMEVTETIGEGES